MASRAPAAESARVRRPSPPWPSEAVFVDLDRTLLRGASGLVLTTALRAEGLVGREAALPGERLFYGFYGVFGETLPFMAMARATARFVKGWPVSAVRRAGELAAPELAELVRPYARGVLEAHRREGRMVVLATTTPVDLIEPFAELFGFDDLIATRHANRDGRYVGGVDGEFVWAFGKRSAVQRWAEAHHVDLRRSYAYSDSVFDVPLLEAVGHARVVHPDIRLRAVALARRWPVEHWDRPDGVPDLFGVEMYHVLRPWVRPGAFPYARFEVSGVEHIPPRGPALLVSNHRSYFDAVALALVAAKLGRPVRFLAKREIFDAPLIGQLARSLGGIRVDREGSANEALVEATRALEAGELVTVLPQGTIPRGEAFFDPHLKPKTGAARLALATGAPVIPVGLWGTEVVWPRSALLPTMTTLLHPPRVTVRVGAPVTLGPDEGVVASSERIMTAISDLLPPEGRRWHTPTSEELARTRPQRNGR